MERLILSTEAVYVGCAGWKLGREYWPSFPILGTHLERYAAQLGAVEINSTFQRSHRPSTYAKWATSVGDDFRFSVKLPKSITHEHRLQNCGALLDCFLTECSALDTKLGCLLVQLPPSLMYDASVATDFFEKLRARYAGQVVIEPRHESWTEARGLLIDNRVAQVAVDPSKITGDNAPGGWPGLRYWRLHGSPRVYYSEYEYEWLGRLAAEVAASKRDGVQTWCIFDNTARDAALGNALSMQELLKL